MRQMSAWWYMYLRNIFDCRTRITEIMARLFETKDVFSESFVKISFVYN